MKVCISCRLLICFFVLVVFRLEAAPKDDFVLVVDTTQTNNEFTILTNNSIYNTPYNYSVDCNDDGVDEATGHTLDYTCNYSGIGSAGLYTIRIKDDTGDGTGFSHIVFEENSGLVAVRQWGTSYWNDFEAMFRGVTCIIDATDAPNMERTVSMARMFRNSTVEITHAHLWDVSNVMDMSSMFQSADVTADVSDWNVSNVKYMFDTFQGSKSDLDISQWNVSSVETMQCMFCAALIDVEVGGWDVSSVTNMSYMFFENLVANPDVSNWNVSQVRDFTEMFGSTLIANPNVTEWNLKSAEKLNFMFSQSEAADPDVSLWNTSQVNDMRGLFSHTTVANPDVSNWDVSNVRHFNRMFQNAQMANPNVTDWNLPEFSNFEKMFYNAQNANPNIQFWNTSEYAAPSFFDMLTNSNISDINYDRALQFFYRVSQSSLDVAWLNHVNASYCRSALERNYLSSTLGWSITDEGKDCMEALNECIFSDGYDGDSSSQQCGIAIQ